MIEEPRAQFVRIAAFAVALGLGLGLQRLSPHARYRGSVWVNGGLWIVNVAVLGTVCGACVCTVARWASTRGVGMLNVAEVPLWAGVALTVATLDLLSYTWHRANHRVPFLWRFHRVHHSDEAFTVSTALRFHPGELLLSMPLRIAAVVVLGAPWQGVLAFEFAFTVANIVEHGDIALPRRFEEVLSMVLVTPALHRRHHSSIRAEIDRNFGTVFTVWDRVLATYQENSSASQVRPGPPDSVRAPTLRAALMLPLDASH